MPITIQNADNKYLLIKYSEDIDSDTFHNFHKELYTYSENKIARYQLVDLSDVKGLNITTNDIQITAFNDINFFKKLEKIFVAVFTPTNLSYGLARMWKSYSESPYLETFVFRDIDAAKNWIYSKIDENESSQGVD